MSMYGRIYVDKNILLEKVRKRKMDKHQASLTKIRDGLSDDYHFKNLTQSIDASRAFMSRQKQAVNRFNHTQK